MSDEQQLPNEDSESATNGKPRRMRLGDNPKPKGVAVVDPDAYTQNLTSDHTKRIKVISGGVSFNIDGDKHFYGQCRERNISSELVINEIVIPSVRHLQHYAAKDNNFHYLNCKIERKQRGRKTVVIEREISGQNINVVIEVHFSKINEYELTITTTMVEEGFWKHGGQHFIEIIDYDTSILKQLINKEIIPIDKLNVD